ncbi:sensor histidine kinase [Halobacteriales archaeon QS_4_70_19]|nr:MAG: sensor histidine kinase [Halobacteriales archaeon QS_4_70_19]
MQQPYRRRMTPLRIAGIYTVLGVAWVLLSEYLTLTLGRSTLIRAQAVLGAVFVGASALLIYGLAQYNRRRLEAATVDLEDRIQQAHVLHRLLRHNLRNKCNIIAGHAEALRTDGAGGSATVIEQQTAEMIDLSEKSNLLRKVSLEESRPVELDLVPIVRQTVNDVRERYPAATVTTALPDEAEVFAHPKIGQAIRELVVNGIKHGDDPVEVRVSQEGTTDTMVRVVDSGGGFPDLERTLLEEGFRESQTAHSKGLGLWVLRYLMRESDGAATVERTDSEGTTVRLRFQPTSSAAIKEFLR